MKIVCSAYVTSAGAIHPHQTLYVRDQKCVQIEPTSTQADLDLSSMVLFPGFVNAHCHLELTHLGPLPRLPFTAWLKALIQALSKSSADNLHKGVALGLNQLLHSGVTTVIDHLSPATPVSVYDKAPLNVVAMAEVLGTNKEMADTHLKWQQEKKWHPLFITPHSIYGLHSSVRQNLLQNPSHLSLHVSESPDEEKYFKTQSGPLADFIIERNGEILKGAPSALLTLQNEFLKPKNSLFVHANGLSEAEWDFIATLENICVVHCPGSYEFFGYNNFDYEACLKRKIPLALGTDSLASNSDLNFLIEIQKFTQNFKIKTLKDLMPVITLNAARALKLEGVGDIQTGFNADFVGFKQKGQTPFEILQSRTQPDFVMSQGVIRILNSD